MLGIIVGVNIVGENVGDIGLTMGGKIGALDGVPIISLVEGDSEGGEEGLDVRAKEGEAAGMKEGVAVGTADGITIHKRNLKMVRIRKKNLGNLEKGYIEGPK
jgi:hypothetical protein